jgi:hypothetical protein
MDRSQPGQLVFETLSQTNQPTNQKQTPSQKMAGKVTQGVDSEFKPQYQKNQKKRNLQLASYLMVINPGQK